MMNYPSEVWVECLRVRHHTSFSSSHFDGLSADQKAQFMVPTAMLFQCKSLSGMLESMGESFQSETEWMKQHPVPVMCVAEEDLRFLIEYWRHTTKKPKEEEEGDSDEIFEPLIHTPSCLGLFFVIQAANYLGYVKALGHACRVVGKLIQKKTPSEIRSLLGLPDDLTREEKNEIRRSIHRTCEDDEMEQEPSPPPPCLVVPCLPSNPTKNSDFDYVCFPTKPPPMLTSPFPAEIESPEFCNFLSSNQWPYFFPKSTRPPPRVTLPFVHPFTDEMIPPQLRTNFVSFDHLP